jgi:tRNA pseudouridine55 synthase
MRLSACDKEYVGVMELGIKTDSHDRTGAILATAPSESVTLEAVCGQAARFVGEQIQVPPMVSALKHKGVRLYRLARKGIDVPREGRKICVYRFEILKKEGPYVHFSCAVSKGTYLRTLIHDLGGELGCFAALSDLRRIRSGDFGIRESVTIDELRELSAGDLRKKVLPLFPSPYADLQKS